MIALLALFSGKQPNPTRRHAHLYRVGGRVGLAGGSSGTGTAPGILTVRGNLSRRRHSDSPLKSIAAVSRLQLASFRVVPFSARFIANSRGAADVPRQASSHSPDNGR